jgi:hypothetical protein
MLCEEMNIPQSKFRNYHTVIGGDYKDFWHVICDMYYDIGNDRIVQMYSPEGYTIDDLDEEKKWQWPLYEAFEKVWSKIDPENNGVHVHFCW